MRDDTPDDADDDPDDPDTHDPGGLDLADIIARQTTSAPTARALSGRARRRPRRNGNASYSGSSPDQRDPQPLGGVLDELIEEQGWHTQVGVHLLTARWEHLVGEVNAAHSEVVSFEDGVLVVRCESTTWATSLRSLSRQIIARLNEELGQGAVIHVRVLGPTAPSWSHGKRSVRGRGPRDTYG